MIYFVLLFFLATFHQSFAGLSSCNYPAEIVNGEYVFEETERCSILNGFDSSCFLQALCNTGYIQRGGHFLYCGYNGHYFTWSEPPTCEASPCASMTIENGRLLFPQYESVTYECNPGYTLRGNTTSECLLSGDVEGEPPICEGNPVCKDGKNPGTLLDGYAESTSPAVGKQFRIGTVLTYTCDFGHRMSGESKRKCLRSGGWSAPKPRCTAVTCEPLQDTFIEHGSSDAQNRTYYEGDIIRFYCNYGYRPIGKTWRTCSLINENTTWTDSTPTCNEIRCPRIGNIEHGSVLNEGNRLPGTTVTFSCHSGYDLVGSFEATCQTTGKWSGMGICNARNQEGCGNPGIPLNGHKPGTDYSLGAEVTFNCNHGFTLIGSSTRLCNRTSGAWTGEQPRCKDPNEFDDIDDIIEIMSNATSAIADDIGEGDNEAPQSGRTINVNYKGGWNIYFIFDASNSVGKQNFERGVNFAKALVKKVGVGEIGSKGARYGAVVFASRATIVFNLDEPYNTIDLVVSALDNSKRELTNGNIGGGTGTTEALRKLEQEMLANTPQRDEAKSAVFLITDGKSNEGGSPLQFAERLKEDHGMFLHCIGVGAEVDDAQLAAMASKPKKEHLFFIADYTYVDDLAAAVTSSEREVRCGQGLGPFAGNVRPRGRVVGGTDASNGAWPWMVGLYHWPNKAAVPTYFCGGSLIAPGWILTAAHCFDPDENGVVKLAEDLVLAAGSNRRIGAVEGKSLDEELARELRRVTMPSPNEQILKVEAIIKHKDYTHVEVPDYDIALLQLKEEAAITSNVKTICLPDQGIAANNNLLRRGENKRPHPYVTGWGSTVPLPPGYRGPLELADVLQQLALPLKGTGTCRKSLPDNLKDDFTDQMMCAGYERGDIVLQEPRLQEEEAEDQEADVGRGKGDSCTGDSGGPLVRAKLINNEDIYYQIGIVSWGVGCSQRNTYGFYTHLSLLIDWIHSNTGDLENR